jgi:hypothetical protein
MWTTVKGLLLLGAMLLGGLILVQTLSAMFEDRTAQQYSDYQPPEPPRL